MKKWEFAGDFSTARGVWPMIPVSTSLQAHMNTEFIKALGLRIHLLIHGLEVSCD